MSTAVQWLMRQFVGVEPSSDRNLPFSSPSILRLSGKQPESEISSQSRHLGSIPFGVGMLAQWLRVFGGLAEDWSWVPWTHIRELTLSCHSNSGTLNAFGLLWAPVNVHTRRQTDTDIIKNNIFKQTRKTEKINTWEDTWWGRGRSWVVIKLK